ncbi:MAG: NAD(P)-dependent oxidoreductase [Chloroflexi bacterium]|nr:NAD(P)-dependent oxidoreductase [Chloroflexota bacterium]
MTNTVRRVLLTGATGYIASLLLPTFRERYDLRLVDVRDADSSGASVEGVQVVDLLTADSDALVPLFRGCDAVVHLGYHRPADKDMESWQARGYEDERRNVDMAERVYRLSLEEGVRRVVVASSNHAADWYEELIHADKMDVVDPDKTPPRSDNYYGWAKITYEALGFLYASGSQGRKLENVQVRIGAPREIEAQTFFPNGPGSDGDAVRYRRDLGAYLSPRDLTQLFVKSLETPDIEDEHGVPFQIFYGISGNARAFWSIVNARKVIGYAPEDDAELKFADEIRRYLVRR